MPIITKITTKLTTKLKIKIFKMLELSKIRCTNCHKKWINYNHKLISLKTRTQIF